MLSVEKVRQMIEFLRWLWWKLIGEIDGEYVPEIITRLSPYKTSHMNSFVHATGQQLCGSWATKEKVESLNF
jgi:hypothetical protein